VGYYARLKKLYAYLWATRAEELTNPPPPEVTAPPVRGPEEYEEEAPVEGAGVGLYEELCPTCHQPLPKVHREQHPQQQQWGGVPNEETYA